MLAKKSKLTEIAIELQGHAIKNQDLLIASGTISLTSSEGLTAVDEDIAAAVRHLIPVIACIVFDFDVSSCHISPFSPHSFGSSPVFSLRIPASVSISVRADHHPPSPRNTHEPSHSHSPSPSPLYIMTKPCNTVHAS
jgi:hypothetical protein